MLDELSKIIQLLNLDNFKTVINREQVLQSKKIINRKPSTAKELFLILSAMNLINAAIKTKNFTGEIHYGMLKQHLSKLLEYILENEKPKFDIQIYIDRPQNCVFIDMYDLQFSFHNITIYERLQNFINSPHNKPTVWKKIPLQKIAGELFNYALEID